MSLLQLKKDFRKILKELKDNRKDVINRITEVCSVNPENARIYTEALFEEFQEAKIERKLSLLFLMDSILKNCKEEYQEYLEASISEAFYDAYAASVNQPDTRKSLRLLFKTWEPHFSGKTIMSIITSIKVKLGEDINLSLSLEEYDRLIDYYKQNNIDPSHLLLQKQMFLDTKKPKKNDESLAYAPLNVKMRAPTKSAAPVEKKPVKSTPPKPVSATRPVVATPLSGSAPIRKPENDMVPKKPPTELNNKPPVNETELKKLGGLLKAKKPGDEALYKIKKKGPSTKHERPSLTPEEEAIAKMRKIRKLEAAEPSGRSNGSSTEYNRDIVLESEYNKLGTKVIKKTNPQVKPPHTTMIPNPNREHSQNIYQHQKPKPAQSNVLEASPEGEFSDDEVMMPPVRPQNTKIQAQTQAQLQMQTQSKIQSQIPSSIQTQSSLQPQSQPQFQSQFQNQIPSHQFQPQSQFSGQILHPQPQLSQHRYPPNIQPQPLQSQPQQNLHLSNQGQPPLEQVSRHPQIHMRSEIPPQTQLQPQSQSQGQSQLSQQTIHHPQFHPLNQFAGQHIPSVLTPGPISGAGPNQPQPQPQPQPIMQPYAITPQPYNMQQFRPHSSYTGGRNQPVNPDTNTGNKLKPGEIIDLFKKSLKPDAQPIMSSNQQDMELVPQMMISARNDSFPDYRTFQKSSDTYDQGDVLIFNTLLKTLKKELPNSIKMKYHRQIDRVGKIQSLSEMIGRKDFKIVNLLYEELPFRCSSCGMRFTNTTVLNKHLDWHFQFNMKLKDKAKEMDVRPPMIIIEHWIRDEGNKNFKATNIQNAEDEYEFQNYVSSSEGNKNCKACGEPFKEVWDKDEEAWLLDGASKVIYGEEEEGGDAIKQKSPSYDLMHFRCYKLCLQNETK